MTSEIGDNLFTKDKSPAPNVCTIQRFHCIERGREKDERRERERNSPTNRTEREIQSELTVSLVSQTASETLP